MAYSRLGIHSSVTTPRMHPSILALQKAEEECRANEDSSACSSGETSGCLDGDKHSGIVGHE